MNESKLVEMAQGIARIEVKLDNLPCGECSKYIDQFKQFKTGFKVVIAIIGVVWTVTSNLFQGALAYLLHKV